MADDRKTDPFVNYNFLVEIAGITTAAFKECSALESSIEVIDYREGGDRYFPNRKLPGKATYTNLTLKRGLTDDIELYKWHMDCLKGNNFRRLNITVKLLDRKGDPVPNKSWILYNAWPAKWSGPAFNAEAHEVAIESIEFAHEGIDVG